MILNEATSNQRLNKLLAKPKLRILTIVRDHMSGLLYAVPNLRALRQRFPDAHITLLANPYGTPILQGCPYVDEIIPFFQFRPEDGRLGWLRGLMYKASAWLQLVGRVDLVVHFRYVGGPTMLFCTLLGRPFQVGYTQDRLNSFLDLNIGRENLVLSSRERNAMLLEGMGFVAPSMEMEMWLEPEEVAWADTFLREQGINDNKPLFILHPGSHWGCNEWLPDRWAALGDALQRRYGGHIVLTGTAGERPLAQQISNAMQIPAINAAGHTSLPQFAALLNKAQLVVSVDTAPTQICQALKIPAVILMGAGNPGWRGGTDDDAMIALQNWDAREEGTLLCNFGVGTCHTSFCRSRLAGIPWPQVLQAANTLLHKQPTLAG